MLNEHDFKELRTARSLLDNPSFAARLTSMVGGPIESGLALLPAKVATSIQKAVEVSLKHALTVALATLDKKRRGKPSLDRLHKAAVTGAGGIGGAFGLAALPVELPVSTTIMLRSIADIARDEGESLEDPEARLACLEVFALGGRSASDDATETGYYAIRTALASTLTEAARHIAQRGMALEGAPALVRFIAAVASRFGIAVSEKVAASAIPAVGALGGGVVNAVFIDHFQKMARGHFKIRKLERKYGKEEIQSAYARLAAPIKI